MRSLLVGLLLLTPACGAPEAASGTTVQAVTSVPDLPTGATLGPGGFATILDAPPAPFVPAPPGQPQPPTAAQRADQEQFRRVGEFQNRVMDEVQALAGRLRRSERGNFVDLYFENEGEPHVVFRFLRDPERTLAKYTKNPSFRAATARFTNAQLMAAMDFMLETFREDRVILGAGTGNKQNRATVEIAIPEEEFRALVMRKGVTIPEEVELEFRARESASTLNRPLPAAIARLVRVFPRDNRPAGPLHAITSSAKVILRDGCFRLADHGDALVLFPIGAQLFIDSEGYLAIGSGAEPGYGRVGETVITPGSIAEVTAAELVEPIRAACGSGKVMKIHGMRSAAADRAQDVVTTNAHAVQEFRESYGLTEAQARTLLEACKRRSGFGVCLTSPPPPVAKQQDCPPGTRLSYGLCRTPEGYIRPLPKWLQDMLGEQAPAR